jgi:hypothetical protein
MTAKKQEAARKTRGSQKNKRQPEKQEAARKTRSSQKTRSNTLACRAYTWSRDRYKG